MPETTTRQTNKNRIRVYRVIHTMAPKYLWNFSIYFIDITYDNHLSMSLFISHLQPNARMIAHVIACVCQSPSTFRRMTSRAWTFDYQHRGQLSHNFYTIRYKCVLLWQLLQLCTAVEFCIYACRNNELIRTANHSNLTTCLHFSLRENAQHTFEFMI